MQPKNSGKGHENRGVLAEAAMLRYNTVESRENRLEFPGWTEAYMVGKDGADI